MAFIIERPVARIPVPGRRRKLGNCARALIRLRDAARALLAPIYGRFGEGFRVADRLEANAIREELG